jgi:hypothetical protein
LNSFSAFNDLLLLKDILKFFTRLLHRNAFNLWNNNYLFWLLLYFLFLFLLFILPLCLYSSYCMLHILIRVQELVTYCLLYFLLWLFLNNFNLLLIF